MMRPWERRFVCGKRRPTRPARVLRRSSATRTHRTGDPIAGTQSLSSNTNSATANVVLDSRLFAHRHHPRSRSAGTAPETGALLGPRVTTQGRPILVSSVGRCRTQHLPHTASRHQRLKCTISRARGCQLHSKYIHIVNLTEDKHVDHLNPNTWAPAMSRIMA